MHRQMVAAIDYPGGWLARRLAAAEARRRATEIAIDRGVAGELLLLEEQAEADLAAAEEPRARWERFAAGWPQWLLTLAVSIMASVGQIQFAKEHGAVRMIRLFGHDITAWFAPAVFDLSVVGLYAFGMYVAVRHKASPWLPWLAGTVIGAFSVYTNTQHEGALFFASASAVLLVTWLVRMVITWQHLPHVKGRRSTAKPRLLTSSLVFASPATARRAWTISRRRNITTCAAQMNKNGTRITERDLVIQAAELFNTVRDDRLIAELDQLGEPPTGKSAGRQAARAWKARRAQAYKRAEIVAWDAVDAMLGLAVIQREGIRVNRVTYLDPEPQPRPARRPLPDSEPRPVAAPQQRRRLPAAGRQPVPETITIQRPAGNKYRNWVPQADIPGLPTVDPAIRCECTPDPSRRCGESLLEHVERRGEQIAAFIAAVPDWVQRPGRIGKPDVAVLNIGSGAAMEVVWLMNQLRAVAGAATAPSSTS